MNNLVFTLTSPAGGGKDLCAEMISAYCNEIELSSFKLAYADYLKVLCARNFGFKDKETDRHILQEFGSLVRSIEKDFWVRTVMETVDMLHAVYDVFIIPDARHENEMSLFPYNLSYPMINVYVKRDFETSLSEDEYNHESEAIANNPDLSKFHYVIDNNGSLEDTYRQVIDMVNDVVTKHAQMLDEQHNLVDSAMDDLELEQSND